MLLSLTLSYIMTICSYWLFFVDFRVCTYNYLELIDLGPRKLLEFEKWAICPEFCTIALENVDLSWKILKNQQFS